MDTSIFLAKLFGATYLLVGLGVFMHQKYYKKMIQDLIKDKGFLYFSGISSFVVGMVIVLFHNIWVDSWPVLITILGWGALVKGAVRILRPDAVQKFAKWWINRLDLLGGVSLLLGVILSYYGFLAV